MRKSALLTKTGGVEDPATVWSYDKPFVSMWPSSFAMAKHICKALRFLLYLAERSAAFSRNIMYV